MGNPVVAQHLRVCRLQLTVWAVMLVLCVMGLAIADASREGQRQDAAQHGKSSARAHSFARVKSKAAHRNLFMARGNDDATRKRIRQTGASQTELDDRKFEFEYLGEDRITKGNWQGIYGHLGGMIFGGAVDPNSRDLTDLPIEGISRITWDDQELPRYEWMDGTDDPRAMDVRESTFMKKESDNRVASCIFSADNVVLKFKIDTPHRWVQLSIYMVDFDRAMRKQEVWGYQDNLRAIQLPDARLQGEDLTEGVWMGWVIDTNKEFKLRIETFSGGDCGGDLDALFPSRRHTKDWVLSGLLLDPAEPLGELPKDHVRIRESACVCANHKPMGPIAVPYPKQCPEKLMPATPRLCAGPAVIQRELDNICANEANAKAKKTCPKPPTCSDCETCSGMEQRFHEASVPMSRNDDGGGPMIPRIPTQKEIKHEDYHSRDENSGCTVYSKVSIQDPVDSCSDKKAAKSKSGGAPTDPVPNRLDGGDQNLNRADLNDQNPTDMGPGGGPTPPDPADPAQSAPGAPIPAPAASNGPACAQDADGKNKAPHPTVTDGMATQPINPPPPRTNPLPDTPPDEMGSPVKSNPPTAPKDAPTTPQGQPPPPLDPNPGPPPIGLTSDIEEDMQTSAPLKGKSTIAVEGAQEATGPSKDLPSAAAEGKAGTIDFALSFLCTHKCDIYVNGDFVKTAAGPGQLIEAASTTLRGSQNVLAIRAEHRLDGAPGFIGAIKTDDGVVYSDDKFLCIPGAAPEGWQKNEFDASSWPKAGLAPGRQGQESSDFPMVPQQTLLAQTAVAQWIWDADPKQKVVFCRREIASISAYVDPNTLPSPKYDPLASDKSTSDGNPKEDVSPSNANGDARPGPESPRPPSVNEFGQPATNNGGQGGGTEQGGQADSLMQDIGFQKPNAETRSKPEDEAEAVQRRLALEAAGQNGTDIHKPRKPQGASYLLSVACLDSCDVYLNGAKAVPSGGPDQVSKDPSKPTGYNGGMGTNQPLSIAIEGLGPAGKGGIIAELKIGKLPENLFVTDDVKWKCKLKDEAVAQLEEEQRVKNLIEPRSPFDPAPDIVYDWKVPSIAVDNGAEPYTNVKDLPKTAKWIWTESQSVAGALGDLAQNLTPMGMLSSPPPEKVICRFDLPKDVLLLEPGEMDYEPMDEKSAAKAQKRAQKQADKPNAEQRTMLVESQETS